MHESEEQLPSSMSPDEEEPSAVESSAPTEDTSSLKPGAEEGSEAPLEDAPSKEAEEAEAQAEEAEDGEDAEAETTEELSELETLRNERNRMKDQLLRTAAEFDNFRKRTRREIEEVIQRTRESILREVLPVIDNLERAAIATETAPDVEALAEGVTMVLRGFEDVATRIGLSRVDSIGLQFDPNQHDAVQQQETDDHAPGTIVAEIVPGYTLGERLLRPALVVVAKPPSAAAANESAESEDNDDAPKNESDVERHSETPEDDSDVVFLEDEDDEGDA